MFVFVFYLWETITIINIDMFGLVDFFVRKHSNSQTSHTKLLLGAKVLMAAPRLRISYMFFFFDFSPLKMQEKEEKLKSLVV